MQLCGSACSRHVDAPLKGLPWGGGTATMAEGWQGVRLRDPSSVLEGSWAKALATATPLGAASLFGTSCFPSSMSSKGENPVHFRHATVAPSVSLPS